MNLDLKMLHSFKKVAELQSMTKAAEELYISQAHLSRIIAALEKEVGAPLFDRVGRKIQLNSCGVLYYEYVMKVLSLLDESVRNVRDEYARSLASLTIASNTGTYLPPVFRKIASIRPDMYLKQYSLTNKHLTRFLLSKKTDFNIVCPPSNNPKFISIPLHRETAVVIYPEGHWLQKRKRVSVKELEKESFVGMNIGYGARDAMERLYVQYHFQPFFAVETTDSALINTYVHSGMGIAVVPKVTSLVDPFFKTHFCEFEENLYGDIALEWLRDRKLNEDDILFCNTALSIFHEYSCRIGTNTRDEAATLADFVF